MHTKSFWYRNGAMFLNSQNTQIHIKFTRINAECTDPCSVSFGILLCAQLIGPCEWVIKFNSLSEDSGQRGPYKPCNHSLYIQIIIFPHIDDTQSTGHN